MEDKIKGRIQQIIDFGEKLLSTTTRQYSEFYGNYECLQDNNAFYEWEALVHSFLISVFGEDSSHYKLFIKNCEPQSLDDMPSLMKRGLGVLRAAKTDIEGGHIKK